MLLIWGGELSGEEINKDLNIHDLSVVYKNPIIQGQYPGNKIVVSPQNIESSGIFIRFDKITIIVGKRIIEKSWEDCKRDLNSEPQQTPNFIPDTILLKSFSYGFQILIFNIIKDRFEIILSNQALFSFPESYIIIAYTYDGMFGGTLYNQTNNDVLPENSYVLDPKLRKNIINNIREKEIDLLSIKENFSMILCTDSHYFLTEHPYANNITNLVIKELDNNFASDVIVNLGDSMIYGTQFKQYAITALFNAFKNIDNDKLVYTVGNHDFNSVAIGSTLNNKKEWIITDSEMTSIVNRHVKATNRPEGKLYYYRDYKEKKVRVIALNTLDVPFIFDQNNTLVYDPVRTHGIRQAQLEWLIESLNSVESGWKVIVCMHVGSYIDSDGFELHKDTFRNRLCLNEIFKAYKAKTTYKAFYDDKDFNGIFSINLSGSFEDARGNLIAVFSGHAHADGYCSRDGFNAIQTTCSYPLKSVRVPNTFDEFSVDFIVFDDMQKKIIIKRFGKGTDREYYYDPKQL